MISRPQPRLLFICQNVPFPPDGGALIRSFHTLRLLSREYRVTALCFERPNLRDRGSLDAALEALSTHAEVEAFPIPQTMSRVRLVWDHVRSVVSGRAYTRWVYESAACRRRIRGLLESNEFDLVHLDSLDLVAYLPEFQGMRVVVAHHNVESSLLARRADSERGLRRRYMQLQAQLTRREEAKWCSRVALNVVVSPEDREVLTGIAPRANCIVVPNGVDTTAFRPAPVARPKGLVFVGGHTWYPNRDGMEYFVQEILPLIRQDFPDLPVTWVGRAPGPVRERYMRSGVHMTGYVDDIRQHVAEAAVFIVPLRVGGGTRLKILDAWALGKAVVSTTAGAEGLQVTDGGNICLADSPREFADAVATLLRDPELRQGVEQAGRRTAETIYDWTIIGENMIATLRSLTTH